MSGSEGLTITRHSITGPGSRENWREAAGLRSPAGGGGARPRASEEQGKVRGD